MTDEVAKRGVLLALLLACEGCAQMVGADFDEPKTRRCSVSAAFEAPVRLSLNDSLLEAWGPRLSADELSLYFTSVGDEFVAMRTTRDAEFSSPRALSSLNSAVDEMAPSVTADERRIFFESTRAGADVKIFTAARDGRSEEFDEPVLLEQVNSTTKGVLDVQPFVTPDGRALYFASTRNEAGNYQLFQAECANGTCGEAQAVPGLGSSTAELWPVVSADELTLYFASSRTQPSSLGIIDVFVARRSKKSEPFGVAENLREVNGSQGDYPGWISEDGCFLYMTRYDGTRRTIFVAKRGR